MKSIEIEDDIVVDAKNSNQIQNPYRLIAFAVFPLGFTTYGGPMAHIAVLKEKFVDKNKWVEEQEFQELFSLCQSLPGPTSSQLVIAIGTLVCKSWVGGLLAFILFSLPSTIFMLLAGLFMKSSYQLSIDRELNWLLCGFQCSAIAIVAQAAYKLSIGVGKNKFLKGLILASAIIYGLYESPVTMYILLLAGAILNIGYSIGTTKYQTVELDQSPYTPNHINKGDFFLGYRSIIVYFIILAVSSFLRYYYTQSTNAMMADTFFKIGSLIVGGGHVILPMMLSELKGWITEEQFWNGFSLVSCMPGPLFNLAIYIGAIVGGIWTGLVAWGMLFLPAFLVVWGFLPYWKLYRTYPKVQMLIEGISAIAVGFIFTAVYLLFRSAITKSGYEITTLIAVVSYVSLEWLKIGSQYVILLSGSIYLIVALIQQY